MLADFDREAETLEGRMQLSDHATRRGNQARSEEKINLFVGLPVEKTLVYFLDLGAGLGSTTAYPMLQCLGNHSQLVIRSNEWNRKSGAEVEEGLDGERDLLVVVEWDVLKLHVCQPSCLESEGFFEKDGPYIRRAYHGTERAR